MKKTTIIFITLIMITLSNCSKNKNEIMYMIELKNHISKTYDIKRVDIKILSDDIKITLTDSRFNNEDSERKQKLANQIGELTIELRGNMPKLKTGELIFIDQTNFAIVKTNKSESFNLFK